MLIDTSFDFRTDAGGRDPDAFSPTLCRYHRVLWSKLLPGGLRFSLDDTTPGEYLHHYSGLGEFVMSSDAVIPDFVGYASMRPVIDQVDEAEIESFITLSYTIGGMMIFPSNRVDGKLTINGARGLYRKIADRLDLTLECIRRHYRGEPSPLSEVLDRYSDFFEIFENFRGYVDFFLLGDLVEDYGTTVRFFLPFDDFRTPVLPADVDAYREYVQLSTDFIHARNHRFATWAARSAGAEGSLLGP